MPKNDSTPPKSWRDVIEVHPAADIYPMMDLDERQKLGADTKANGLRSPFVFWAESENSRRFLFDGRNRLDAMEAVGLPTFEVREDKGNRIDWLVPMRTYYGSANMMSIDGQSRRRPIRSLLSPHSMSIAGT